MSSTCDIFFKDVSFAYGNLKALENVNLEIPHREFASVVGPNGGGKTTLLKMMLGLLDADSGEIGILGESPAKARLRVGYMPQHTQLDPDFPVTAMDVALMGRLGHGWGGRYSKADREAAREALAEVKLADVAKRHFAALSGGQRQRVLIARALCCRPELLLLDEPTANVDPSAEEALFDILSELNRQMTILLVSHDLGFVSQIVNTVICVNRQVVVHPTSQMNGSLIKDLYGGDYRMVRHDHRCSAEGHRHV